MQPSITCYLDSVSPYSYFAFTHLQRHAALLSAHNITTTYVPVFLGGINAGSGNKPPWTLPAKAAYADTDMQHAKRHFGLPNLIKRPSVFPTNTLRAQRGLTYIAAHHPPHIYHEAFRLAWVALWEHDTDISQPDLLQRAWTAPDLFTPEQLQQVLAAAEHPEWKDRLQENTRAALDSGAFGAPWFVVRNGRGEESVFFGSDRFAFMWTFLGLPGDGGGGGEGDGKGRARL